MKTYVIELEETFNIKKNFLKKSLSAFELLNFEVFSTKGSLSQ